MSDPFQQPLDAATRLCAVYGHPVRHSASPAMQNAGFASLGLNWRYLAFDVGPEHLRDALEGAKRMNFVGVNLTVPHKMLAVEMMDVVDPAARDWGAVNTVVFEGRDEQGQWRPLRHFTETPPEIRSHGFNTDADAIVQALREDLGVKLAGAAILLRGAGGAGRTAALRLAQEGVAELYLVNRTRAKAEELAGELQQRQPSMKVAVGYPATRVDLTLNATSLGLKANDGLPIDTRAFPLANSGAVYDLIYRPAETPFLAEAKAAGCQTANGLGMLLFQGAKALELWTGRAAPMEVMRRALELNVYGS